MYASSAGMLIGETYTDDAGMYYIVGNNLDGCSIGVGEQGGEAVGYEINFEGKYIKYTGDIGLNGKGNLYLGAEANKEKLASYGEIDDEYTSIREYRNL